MITSSDITIKYTQYTGRRNTKTPSNASGTPTELWVGGTQLLPKDAMLAEATRRYRKARNAPR